VIYFLRCEKNFQDLKVGWIKIGTTIRLSERLKQITYEIGHMPTVLGILDGGHKEEKLLHRRFAAMRAGEHSLSEWFYPKSELLKHIESKCKKWDGSDEVPLDGKPVRLPSDVHYWARIVATFREESISDVLGEILRPILKEMAKDLVLKTNEQIKAEKEVIS
jgi:hypothetical protein